MSFPSLVETSEATRKELDCKKNTENPHNNYNVKHELSCAKYASFQESAESLLISMVTDLNQCGAQRLKCGADQLRIMRGGTTQMWGGSTQDYVGRIDRFPEKE